jgi:ribosomal protein S18 acetylase RimI-like enzyme
MSETPETDEIELPGAPALPGLVFRRYRGEADIPLVLALANASEEADQSGRMLQPADVSAWFHPNALRSAIFAELQGELAAFGRTYGYVTYAHEHIYGLALRVAPLYRRKGLGRSLLHYLQSILQQIAAGDPPPEPQFYEVQVLEHETALAKLLEEEGYQPVRTFYQMVRTDLQDIPEVSLPPGFELRPARPEHYRTILDALVEAFIDTWGASPPPEDNHDSFLSSDHSQPELWQVAWDGDQVAGMILAWIPQQAEDQSRYANTDPIVVLPRWQKRGLARALLSHSLLQLRALGLSEARLTVDSENPHQAAHLYESMGYQAVNRMTLFRKALDSARNEDV